jgi:hypothetical protein
MQRQIQEVLHRQIVDGLIHDKCIVEGCRNWQKPYRVKGILRGYYVLCGGHWKLARDKFLGKVPENYVPSLGRHIYPDHPKCIVVGCEEYSIFRRASIVTGIRLYSRFCAFHANKLNRGKPLPETSRPVDYTLPMPPLVSEKVIEIRCSVPACLNSIPVAKRTGRRLRIEYLCRHHRALRRQGLPMDYVYQAPPSERVVRKKCEVAGCDRMQANKGLFHGVVSYDKYCERHRRGFYKTKKEGRIKPDPNLCSRCGWKGPCDKHRLVAGKDGGNYRAENVIVVCPNCHRLLHRQPPSLS